jgi:hypothetical protein
LVRDRPVGAWFRLATLAPHRSRATGPLVVPAALPPVSVVYQDGEPGHGRVAAWFNVTVGGGLPVLTPRSAVWINLLAVEIAFPVAALIVR